MTSRMRAEVAEIPEVTRRFLAEARASVAAAGAALRVRDPDVIVTVARGSSDHAATYLQYATELVAGVPVASVGPSIASIYGRRLRLGGAACIGISQSGQSPDIVAMLAEAGRGGAVTVAITNVAEAPLARAAGHALVLGAGPERSVAATKSFVASVVAALALVAEWQGDAALAEAIGQLPDDFATALGCDWGPLSDRLARAGSAFVLGRGPGVAIASEMALKLKETSALQAEAYSAAEVLHGPAAIVGAGFPVLVLGVADAALPEVAATAARLAAQGAEVFVTGVDLAGATHLPMPPPRHPLTDPLVLIVAFYAMVEALARRRGLDPDAPPHLRKVTETR